MTSMIYPLKGKKVWVAGHRGMVGSAICRRLHHEQCDILTASRSELDLLSQSDVADWVAKHKPQAVFVAAAKVGGIYANDTKPAEFLYDNLMIQNNIIQSSYKNNVEKLIFLGSSCIYPKFAEQPITEDALLTGSLEPTNEWYALAKIAGIKLCQAYRKQYGCDYIAAMPTNLYGIGDNYDLTSSHVIPALLRKAYEAKQKGISEIEIWGTGTPRREFLYVDDCADAVVFLMQHYSDFSHVNVGSGTDLPIEELALLIMDIIGIQNPIISKDTSKPDGTPRKLMSGAMIKNMGWSPKIDLRTGLMLAYNAFCQSRF
jgi:GDP-L-fucose synthase